MQNMTATTLVAMTAFAAVGISACGATPAATLPGTSVVTQTVTLTATPTSTVGEDSPTSSQSDGMDGPTETVVPTGLPPLTSGQPLGLDAFFEPSYIWSENRFDVADRGQVQGIYGLIEGCRAVRGTLELRLANKFTNLKFSVGQDNASPSSEDQLVVAVITNGKQADVRRIPFNVVQDFNVPATGVNAAQIQFSRTDSDGGCGSMGSVGAVMFNATLE